MHLAPIPLPGGVRPQAGGGLVRNYIHVVIYIIEQETVETVLFGLASIHRLYFIFELGFICFIQPVPLRGLQVLREPLPRVPLQLPVPP
jgi:hypothetical protein